jgi:hypothetical protein
VQLLAPLYVLAAVALGRIPNPGLAWGAPGRWQA